MPTLDSIKNKYHFNIDEISDIIFMWAKSEDEEDFIRQFVDKFEIEENDVFSERDLTTLYDELSESDEIQQIVGESKKLHNERSSIKYRSRRPLRKFESHKPTMKESKLFEDHTKVKMKNMTKTDSDIEIGYAGVYRWDAAMNYSNYNKEDWHLPTIKELKNIVTNYYDEMMSLVDDDGSHDFYVWSSTDTGLGMAYGMNILVDYKEREISKNKYCHTFFIKQTGFPTKKPINTASSHMKFESKKRRAIKESFGSDFKEGDSVIVKDRNDANLGIGQVITIDRIDGNYIIFTRRGKSFGIPKSCVKSLNESKKRSSQQRTMTGQYVQMIKEGHSHKAVVEAIAKKYGMSVAEAENTINECLGVAGINRKRVIKEAEEEQNFETQDTENFEDFENNEEDYDEIADKVLIYMMKNSNDYKQLYRNIEDAVDATLTFMRLKDQIGENGTKKIVDIIKDKYVDDFNFNDTDYMDDDSITDKVEESCVDKYALECVNENVGTPNYWTMDEKHYIAGFEDKLFTEEAVSKLKENKYFDFIAENENYSFIYILKKVKGE